MSIRFAAAGTGTSPSVLRVVRRLPAPEPANDVDNGLGRDLLLQAALRHFALHGLGAAEQARSKAEAAMIEGDHEMYRHWRDICRRLDRRLARQIASPRNTIMDGQDSL